MMNKVLFAALLAAFVSACDYVGGKAQSTQRTDAAYRAAMEDYRAGRLDQAIAGFRKVCRDDPSNSSARFQLACLLLDASRDHAGAYCAFREYLLQQPGSDKERLARDRLAACEKEFARELAAKHGLADAGAEASAAIASLKEKLAASEKEREAQRRELAEAQKSIAALSAQVKHLKSLVSDSPDAEAPSRDVRDVKALLAGEDDDASAPAPNAGRDVLAEDDPDLAAVAPIAQPKDAKEQRAAAKEEAEKQAAAQAAALKAMRDRIPDEYVVEEGDTLYKIATKFYGKASAWKLIRDANRAIISTDGRVKTGQKLKLPK